MHRLGNVRREEPTAGGEGATAGGGSAGNQEVTGETSDVQEVGNEARPTPGKAPWTGHVKDSGFLPGVKGSPETC